MKFIDLNKQYQKYQTEIDQAINQTVEIGDFINWKNVKLLEEEVAKYCNTKYAIWCNSWTDALKLSLMSLELPKWSEIITTSFTFVATVEIIEELGYKSVFVDIDKQSYNIDPYKIEKKITNKTKAIIPVHLYGQMCNMEKIMEIAKKHNLAVIEDCAQAFWSKCNIWISGWIGDLWAHSFFPTKNLAWYGDGWIITTNDQEKYEYIKAKRNHWQKVKYIHETLWVSSRLDTIQASIIRVKLKHFEEESKIRKEKFDYYMKNLSSVEEIKLPKQIYWDSVTALFNIQAENRDKLSEYLKENWIPTMIYYPIPMHLQQYFIDKYLYRKWDYPITEKVCENILSLPFYPYISQKDQDKVINTIKDFYKINK